MSEMFDDDDTTDYYEHVDDVTCYRCNTPGLSRVFTGVRYVLADKHGIHVCPNNTTADDFEIVT